MAISNEAAKIIKTGTAALSDKKAENIKVIDISEISVIADALVIASGNNPKQIQAMSDEVDEKQPVAVIEAMKMETNILAPAKGTVDKIYVSEGQQVKAGELVVKLK